VIVVGLTQSPPDRSCQRECGEKKESRCVKQVSISEVAIPLLVRRGGCGIKKISAKPSCAADGVVAHKSRGVSDDFFLMAAPYRACAGSARRPLSRPPLLTRRGISKSTHSSRLAGSPSAVCTHPQNRQPCRLMPAAGRAASIQSTVGRACLTSVRIFGTSGRRRADGREPMRIRSNT